MTIGQRQIANVAIDDPELTYGMLPLVTADTGLDALTHNIEAYLAKGYHPMCDAIALSGANLAYSNLPAAVRNGRDADARANMLMASMIGAVAFQKGLGVTHPLTHPLSSIAGLHHGTTNGVLLPHVLEFNRAASGDRLSDLAIAMSPCRWNLSSGRKLRTCCMGESADGRAVHHPRSAERV